MQQYDPCFEVLARRKIPIDKSCSMCKCIPKSVLHGLLVFIKINLFFYDFILVCFSRLNLVELGLLCVYFWKIWSQRNAYVHDFVLLKDLDVVAWAHGFLAEVHDGRVIKSRAIVSSSISGPAWFPHDPDLY
ncbi:hypothetical protein Ddye_024154 [Dipteronia dyeriana]|uniref:Uncharacterized protein n=1 Tax=Dipteronia dyeriana TaxID=168575 RepID=A0AAD9WTB3_9ROSI|nr:hypothetical protein Ddye_024154 [Dipteronia dyeriana]